MANSNDLKLRVLFDMVDGATKPLRNILNGNKGLAKSLKESREELGKLQRTQKDVAAFREMRVGLNGTRRDMQSAQSRVAELARTIGSTDSPTKQMVAEFERAKRTAAQLTAEHDKQADKVRALRDRLAGAGIDTRNLSEHERNLRSCMAATIGVMTIQQNKLADLTTRTKRLAEAREKMNRTKELAGSMAGTGAKMMAGGAVVGAATLVPIAAYAQAEESATQLASALMRAGGVVPPEFEKINTLAMKLGDRLPGTTSDFQNMMTMLTRQGISAESILGGMGEATAYLGVQLKKAPAEAAEFVAKLQDATRTTEKDMLSLTDVIQKSFMLGVDDNNMLDAFAKLGPAMDTIKIKGLEGAKALAPLLVMADQSGLIGGSAGNAFRKVFQLGMDAKKVGKANKQLAPAQRLDFTNGKGEFGGLDKMFAQFQKLKGLTTQKREGILKEIFGEDAETLQAVSLMVNKGKEGYEEVVAKMAAQASMQERVNKQLGTLKNLWESATGTFTNALVAFGASIAPEMKGVVQWLGDMAQGLGQWARDNPKLANGLMKVAAGVALLLTAGGALVVMLAGVLGPLAVVKFSMTALGMQGGILARVLGLGATAWRVFASAAMFAGRAMLMNPIGLAITAIAAAALAIYVYWEPIKAFFGGLWPQVQQAFAGGISGIGALIVNWSPLGLFYQAFAAVLSWFGVDMPAKFSEFGGNLIAGLVNGITSGLGAVQAAITNVATSTVGWFKEKLGIHSPSRVFGELGGFITRGAAIGMEGEQGRIAKAAVGLATLAATSFAAAQGAQTAGTPAGGPGAAIDTRPALQARQATGNAAGAASSAGGDTYIFQISGGGSDEIETRIRKVLADIERKKASRVSSRLSD
ncbi:phage tail tape measure protein [Paraburkholderia phenoliruptrix]|uniref:phage tail tape measure protein n=1 Tax=Paraburkholderia phenoliruptrix TaxID=252970 RepID=UPI00285AFFBB|nr:phage tail tape measure protein [Paraburkholderia phenoliruptrix]MDR6387584.1 TP901 family phage tail tape measure protein [Paraburkholderia phenoliruptrix]